MFFTYMYTTQEAVSRLQEQWYAGDNDNKSLSNIGLDNLNIGPPIAKGCAAVVYAAAIKPVTNNEKTPENIANLLSSPDAAIVDLSNIRHEMMSPIQNTSRFLHNFGGSVDNLYFNRMDRSRFDSMSETNIDELSAVNNSNKKVHFNTMVNVLQGHSRSNSSSSNESDDSIAVNAELFNDKQNMGDCNSAAYPLALKMMFNYDIQSNAMTILRAMYKETIPARNKQIDVDGDNWQKL